MRSPAASRPGASSCPPGRRGRCRLRTRPRYAVVTSPVLGSARVSSCSRWESSRTSTFSARCRRIERSSVSRSSRPPGSAQRPRAGARARRQRSACSWPSRTCSTTAAVCWAWVVSCGRGFRFIVVNYRRSPMKRVVVVMCAVALLAAGSAGAGEATPAKTLKVGMVTDVGGLNDHGFNHLAYVGLLQAKAKLGAQIRVAESRSSADYIPNLAAFARQGYDLVIGVGYTEIGAMGAVAKRFPNTHFAIVDVANGDLAGKPKNVLGMLFREEQVGYLAGYLAGLETKRLPGRDVVSSVAGEKQPPVDRFIAGYQAGAKKANPKRQGAERLLAGLQRPGEVQGDRAEPDRRRVARGVRGRRRLRPRRARCRPHREGVGDRRRRRPVVPRPAHPHERDEEGRPRRVPRDHVRAAGPLPRRGRDLRAEGGRRRPRQDQRRGCRRQVGERRRASSGVAGAADPARDDRSARRKASSR